MKLNQPFPSPQRKMKQRWFLFICMFSWFGTFAEEQLQECLDFELSGPGSQTNCQGFSGNRGDPADILVNGLSVSCSTQSTCSVRPCFLSSTDLIATIVSTSELYIDLKVDQQQVSLRACGGLGLQALDSPCISCRQNLFFRLTADEPIEVDVSPFLNFSSPKADQSTSAPSKRPTSFPQVLDAPGNHDFNPLTLLLSTIIFGLLALVIVASWKLKKNNLNAAENEVQLAETVDSRSLDTAGVSPVVSTSTNGRLHQVLVQRFSLNSSIGWRPISLATDVSSISLQTYKSHLSEQDRIRTQQLRASSVNLNKLQEIIRCHHLATTEDWAEKARRVVKAVHSKIQAQMKSNESFNAQQLTLTGFHGEILPFHLEAYIFRLVIGLNRWFSADSDGTGEAAGIRCLLFAVIYWRKIKVLDNGFEVTSSNVHRLFLVLMLVAAKITEDELISNQFWAEVSGIELEEINLLEQELCFESGLDFNVEPRTLRATCREFGVDVRMGLSFAGEPPVSRQFSGNTLSILETNSSNNL